MQTGPNPEEESCEATQVLELPPLLRRVASVDTLRGLVILLMIFVNDLGPAAPSWMLHIQPPDADGMTLADVVFPAFLFIVGVSIPLAVERSRRSGKSLGEILRHVASRTVGLLAMGLVGVNQGFDTTLGSPAWGVLAFIAIVFAWCLIPSEPGTARTVLRVIKGVGIVGLVFLLAIFRSEPVATEVMFIGPVEDWVWLRTQWWGILGLIGWAYLVASLVYLSVGHRREWLMGATAMLVLVYFAFNGGGLFVRVNDKSWLQPILPAIEFARSGIDFLSQYIDIGGATGSLAAVSVAGCLLGSILIGPQQIEDHPSRLRWSLAFAFGLFLGGLLCDPLAGINKIAGTPTWGLWSASLTCLVWAVVYLIMDVRGVTRWSVVARPAGANPLIAYLLHPVLIGCLSLTGLSSTLLAYKSSQNVGVVVAGSVIMSLTVCALTGLIARAGLRVRI